MECFVEEGARGLHVGPGGRGAVLVREHRRGRVHAPVHAAGIPAHGAVVGGLVLGVVEVLATYIPEPFGGSAWKDVWAFILLILVLVFRPQGLLGARVVDRA